MDKYNRFFSKGIYRLVRLDWLVIMAGLSLAVGLHWRDVNWTRFWVYFWIIDFVGTAPGMYHYYRRQSAKREVPRWCFTAYNVCHSFVTHALVILVWYWIDGLEWALLAMPIHVAADRGVFGNIYKSWGTQFEPVPDAGFSQFATRFERAASEGDLVTGELAMAQRRGD